MSGIDLLEKAKKANPAADFVMMTAYATPQTAVESMKKGAIDYLIKPFAIDELRALIRRIEATRTLPDTALPTDNDISSGEIPLPTSSPAERSAPPAATPNTDEEQDAPPLPAALQGIVAESSQMHEVISRIRKVAQSTASILLRGESGTGKEVMANAIHSLSSRATGPHIKVNCGAIPESLMESELFGHVKGAFTGAQESRKGHFEAADNGTIFLDEIGDLPLHLQVKLLRVLQVGEIQRVGESTPIKVNARVIAATNRDLEADVTKGLFRQDLYYRLNVIPIYLPPLRQRPEDLPILIERFLQRYSTGAQPKHLSPEARRMLSAYDYPGNIRELENAIEHAVVLSEGDLITPSDLPFQIQNYSIPGGIGGIALSGYAGGDQPMHLEDIEKRCIMGALEKSRYNYTRAAAHLGITRRTLGYRIQKYGLEDLITENIRLRKAQRNKE
jgi:DNA-binding NtrC family response regulator